MIIGQISNTAAEQIHRPVQSQKSFHDASEYVKPRKNRLKQFVNKFCTCTPKEVLKSTFPILQWLPRYRWRDDLPCDIIAGVTMAIMQIPQGLGYALLANVPAAVGIYMAVFPVIPYIIFGTSRHNSMGTFAVISLLVGRVVTTYSNNPEFTYQVQSLNGTEVHTYTEIQVGASLTLLVALWQFAMWSLRLGAVCALLSDVLVNSFTCGAGIHIFTTQIKAIIGVSTQRYSGPFQLVYTYTEIVRKLINATSLERQTTWAALIVSAFCIVALVINIYVIKPRLAQVTRIPFPCELVLVIAGVLLSSYIHLYEDYGLKPIGHIPKGLPQPEVPQLGLAPHLVVDSFITAVVSYATLMSMALILARGETYQVDANQELLAMGAGNVVGSCFSCIAFAASLSRSIVAKSVGGRTQLAAFVSGILIVVTLIWIADFFEPLPRAVLACIIIVALRSVLFQVGDLPAFWRLSRADGLLWLCVFLAVVLIDIDVGLLIGFLLSAGCVFRQGMKSYTCLLGNVPNTDLYLDIERYKAAREIDGIKVVHYCGALNFATRQRLRDEIARLSGISPQREIRRLKKQQLKLQQSNRADMKGTSNLAFEDDNSVGSNSSTCDSSKPVWCIVLELSAAIGMDPSAAQLVKTLRDEYREIGIDFLIAGCSGPVYEKLDRCYVVTGDDPVNLFPSAHDATRFALASRAA